MVSNRCAYLRCLVQAVALCVVVAANTSSLASERFRTLWRGQLIDYVEIGDNAVTDGDIVIGRKDIVRAQREAIERYAAHTFESGKALAINAPARLWLPGSNGVAEVPYVYEAGPATAVADAVAEFNRSLSGIIQWVPRTTQGDYVSFNLATANAGACYSSVGRAGGRQEISGDTSGCGVAGFLHEMGHAIGLLHGQNDPDAVRFIDVDFSRIDAGFRYASKPFADTITINGYDYGSIMHYGRGGFGLSLDPVSTETRPPGMELGGAATFSRSDLEAIAQLYGVANTITTVTTLPAGLRVIVDGVSVLTPATFNWPIGSVHRLWVPAGLQTLGGFSFGFGRWSHDASAAPSSQLTWQIRAGVGARGEPTSRAASSVLTANFVRLIEAVATPSSAVGGSSRVTTRAQPWPGTTSMYPQFSAFDLTGSAAAGYSGYFTWTSAYIFNGGGAGATTTARITGQAAKATMGALFSNAAAINVAVQGDVGVEQISLTAKRPDGSAFQSIAPSVVFTAGTAAN